jgi:hypothetical protein
MRGKGVYADQMNSLFHATVRRLHLNEREFRLSTDHFRRPDGPQRSLF